LSGTEGILKLRYRRKQNGKTYIANQFYQLPLQVLPPYYDDADGTAFTYLLNPSGGVLQNDRLTVEITVEEGARALVTTPSAGKFYKMEEGHAELINQFDVASGAVLEYLPEYNIPYANTRIYQENIFRIRKDSVLIAADMIIPGRTERGELFQYDVFSSKVQIFVDDELKAYEYVKSEPKKNAITGFGILESRKIYATVFLYAEKLPDGLLEEVREILKPGEEKNMKSDETIGTGESSQPGNGVYGGISFLDESLGVVKIIGDTVSDMQDMTEEIWGAARRHLLGKDRVRIRKF